MENWEQINAVQMQESYIEEHLDRPITLHALAKNAGYSPWHCAKILKNLRARLRLIHPHVQTLENSNGTA